MNAVIEKHGTPALIRLEMARNLKESKKDRKKTEWIQKENRKWNEEADREMSPLISQERKHGVLSQTNSGISYFSRTERSKYRMWKEQKHICLYCGKPMSINDLLDSAETEHIIPQSTFGQNYMNTVLSCKSCNREKEERTPYEAWGGAGKWERIKERLKTNSRGKCEKYPELHPAKIKRILSEKSFETDAEGFVQRQLNDTSYIATSAKNILSKLGIAVRISKGQAAAHLRQLWGINDILPQDPEDIINYEIINQITGELIQDQQIKRRDLDELLASKKKDEIIKTSYKGKDAENMKNRMDHRHHAVDAFLAAMMDNGLLMRLTKLERLRRAKRNEERKEKRVEKVIKGLDDDIKAIKQTIRFLEKWESKNPMRQDMREILVNKKVVSHQKINKVWGALHEETIYGAGFLHNSVSTGY